MAGLENLTYTIYHEKQQPGSMLCAQHALNSLLQGNYFTAPDLSDIARHLDELEHSFDQDHTGSTNMDDTGFFSVQVLDNALKVWGLNLTRWRGEEMRPYQDRPHTQLAFILNLEQHWFTLRRFGHAEANIDQDLGDGHWFNLNSSLPAPEWISKLYLGMFLQQAEADGYSVFAVTQADPSAPLALPRTDADVIASTLPEPTSAARPNLASLLPSTTHSSTVAPGGNIQIEGFEDEDYELQAALQASLMGADSIHGEPSAPPPLRRGFASLPSSYPGSASASSASRTPTEELAQPIPPLISTAEDDDDEDEAEAETEAEELDPVATSMARNRLMLQRMRAEQEFAQRELWGEAPTALDTAAFEARRAARRREEEEEAEHLRLAIEESEALAREQGHEGINESTDMDVDRSVSPSTAQQNTYPDAGHGVHERVYDDDDAELQAALRASLEHLPEGWQLPELPQQQSPAPPIASQPAQRDTQKEGETEREDVDSVMSVETGILDNSVDAPAEAVSVDELRRRRLARFGAS